MQCNISPHIHDVGFSRFRYEHIERTSLSLPTPDQNVYHARTHFREKGGIFSMGGANSRNQEKAVILQEWVREILKKGNILRAFITICLFRMFELLCINVIELWSWFRSNEKYDIHKNV